MQLRQWLYYYCLEILRSKELCHYGVKGMKWGVRRTPEELGHKRSKKGVEKPSKSSTIVQDAIKSGRVSTKIKIKDQIKHTLNEHLPGRSYLYGGLGFAQRLIDELSGTGEPVIAKGEWRNKERVVAPNIIGIHVDNHTGVETETNRALIIYSKKGSHIFPGRNE